MFWGLTPALDLQSFCCKNNDNKKLNFLIVGGADCRHVLKTIARKYRHEKVQLNFYIMEGCMELVARELLFLLLAFMQQRELGEVQKTRIFMEIYGNTVVRPYVGKFLASTAKELLSAITDYEHLKKIMPFVNLNVKYKDRDYLENLIKFWCSSDEFDILHSWDRRVRKMLGMRYDAKFGAFDWDLHMRLHSIGGKQVSPQEYKSFRKNGVSFTWLESEVSKPNRSLICATVPNGEKFIHYGYLGDIQTGPFVTYGLECEDEEFLRSTNGQNRFRATDVIERNLRQIFHEIEFGEEYQHSVMNDYLMGALRMQEANQMIDISADQMISRPKDYKSVDIDDVSVTFMSISQLKQMAYKEDFKAFFNLIYFCSTHLQFFEKEVINNVAAQNAVLLVENQRYVLSYRDKELKGYADKVKEKLDGVNAVEGKFDCLGDDYFEFILNAT
ncbi:dynein axonemal assembly factor 3 homolog [Coccinella septempunctata]|uniref:dynein axonemal assembly factor 3 homolog n=1 Tax=Coccinella septempunctata TaxID=41139 RepID=UPI001D085A4F|nr:dynein axonemal assembly factor 3 homolog [Coccinella septempunctata]